MGGIVGGAKSFFGGTPKIPGGQFNAVDLGDPSKPLSSFNVGFPGASFTGSLEDGALNTEFLVPGTPESLAAKAAMGTNLERINELGQTIQPGFSDIRKARDLSLSRARERALGTVESNLAQRKISGSGFGNANLAQAEAAFGEVEANAQAQSFVEEFNANQQNIQQRGAQAAQLFNTFLSEAGLGAGLTTALGGLASQAQNLNNQLLVQQAVAEGDLELRRDLAEAQRINAEKEQFANILGSITGFSAIGGNTLGSGGAGIGGGGGSTSGGGQGNGGGGIDVLGALGSFFGIPSTFGAAGAAGGGLAGSGIPTLGSGTTGFGNSAFGGSSAGFR